MSMVEDEVGEAVGLMFPQNLNILLRLYFIDLRTSWYFQRVFCLLVFI